MLQQALIQRSLKLSQVQVTQEAKQQLLQLHGKIIIAKYWKLIKMWSAARCRSMMALHQHGLMMIHIYSFNGWDPEPVPVVADATYVAKYKTALKEVVDPRDFVFADTGEGYTLCGYYGSASRVVIPETYNDKPVVSLEKWAFFNLDNLVSVTLPNNLRKIGEDVFADCDNLKHVDFGNGVQEIGFMAFNHCPSLEAISLPDSVETI